MSRFDVDDDCVLYYVPEFDLNPILLTILKLKDMHLKLTFPTGLSFFGNSLFDLYGIPS